MNTTLALVLLAAVPGGDPVGPLRTVAEVDLGELKAGPVVAHTFDLTHAGDAGTITLSDIESGCGCAKPELTAKELKPGEAAKLTVRVNTLTQREGPNGWPVRIHYRHGTTEHALDLKLTAKLVREVSVTPPLLAVSTAGSITQTLKVEDRRAKPFAVSKVVSSNPAITATIGSATSGTQEVTVAVKEELTVGTHDATVTLHTDDPAYPLLVVPVKVHKRGPDDPVATPAAATVRFAKGQAEASALVQIRHGGKKVGIAKAECSTAGVTVKHSEGHGPVATLRVVVAAATAGATGQTEVTVTLSLPAGGKLVIPVDWHAP
jgi:hypothetical protein